MSSGFVRREGRHNEAGLLSYELSWADAAILALLARFAVVGPHWEQAIGSVCATTHSPLNLQVCDQRM